MADEVRLIDAEKLKQKLIEGDGHDDDRFTEGYNFAINEVREYIDSMPTVEAEPVNSGWISVEDRLPEKEQKVFVFYKALGQENRIHNDVMATNWRTKKGDFIPCDGYKVTHWRPLPKPPKGE